MIKKNILDNSRHKWFNYQFKSLIRFVYFSTLGIRYYYKKKVDNMEDKYILVTDKDEIKCKIDKSFLIDNREYISEKDYNKIKKGYIGYECVLIINNINVDEIGYVRNKFMNELNVLLDKLEYGKVYSLLVNVYDENRFSNSAMLPYSIFIYKNSKILVFSNILIKYLIEFNKKYDISSDISLEFLIREWYSKKKIEIDVINIINSKQKSNNDKLLNSNNNVLFDDVSNKVDDLYDTLIDNVDKDLIMKNVEFDNKINLNRDKFIYNKIKYLRKKCIPFRLNPFLINKLPLITGYFNYNLYKLDKFSYFFLNKSDVSKKISYEYTLLEIVKVENEKKFFIIQSENKVNEYGLIERCSHIIYEWTDYTNFKNRSIKRYYLDNMIEFDYYSLFAKNRRNFIKNIELKFNFPSYYEESKEYLHDEKIGVIDFETFQINNDNEQCVFSGGWATKDKICCEYLDKYLTDVKVTKLDKVDNSDLETIRIASYNLIKKIIDSILENGYNDYTFFIHNLGFFDYLFIIKALCYFGDEYKVDAIIKKEGNRLVYLKISKVYEVMVNKNIYNEDKELIGKKKFKTKKNMKLKLLDSNQIIPGKLKKLAEDFDCEHLKGYFPYKFMNLKNLHYIGNVPSYEYFSDCMDFNDYNIWKNKFQGEFRYNIKNESIKYLESDLLALLDLVSKFSKIIFEKFSINITKIKTISGLAFLIYFSSFYKYDYHIKHIKGYVEKEIRQAYYGGLVYTKRFYKHNSEAYVYDANSQYPSAMLSDMPVGNPVLSTDKDLYSYFGFVYAEIIPPKDLKVYFIPKRDYFGNIITPNYPFEGMYYSELLKEAEKYGYQINVLWGYKFNRGKNIFEKYVYTLYNGRLKAKEDGNNALQICYKLLLNSLYGRFGMKNIQDKLKIVTKKEADKIMSKKSITFYSEIYDKVVLRYNNNVNKNIIKFTDINKNNRNTLFDEKIKMKGVPSSIPIAAATTATALINLLEYLNIPDNELIYMDTDSTTLKKVLNDKFVSRTELGKMKLECKIREGVYISPKFYGLKTDNGDTVIKTKGVAKGKLKYEDLEKLCDGEDLSIETTSFRKSLADAKLSIVDNTYTIKGKNSK